MYSDVYFASVTLAILILTPAEQCPFRHKLSRVLCDIALVTGMDVGSPSVAERFDTSQYTAGLLSRGLRLAVRETPRQPFRNGLVGGVLVNTGAAVKVNADLHDTLEWLGVISTDETDAGSGARVHDLDLPRAPHLRTPPFAARTRKIHHGALVGRVRLANPSRWNLYGALLTTPRYSRQTSPSNRRVGQTNRDWRGKAMNIEAIRAERRRLLHKPRRIIYNDDGCGVLYEMDTGTKEAFLAARSNALANTQVDSVFYTPTCSGFGQFTYGTDIGDRLTCTEAPSEKGLIGNFSKNRLGDLLDQGMDPLAIQTEFCHEHGIECFCSFRMNDTHDGWAAWYSHHLFNPLKRAHRSWLVGEGVPGVRGNSNPYGSWTAVDYSRQEVRDLAVAFVDEVCRRFDIDGVELDYCRHYVYFKSQAWGREVSEDETAMMSDMVRTIRSVVEEHSVRRGRPILLAVRVTDSAPFRLAMGLDLETWLREDYVDMMAVSDYWRFSPWEANVELGHRYGKKVFACLSESRERDKKACDLRNSIEGYRARAMQALRAGMDGIYLFNAQDVSSEVIFNELGDPDLLRTLPKVYVSTARGVGNADFWMHDATTRFLERSFVCPSRPRAIAAGETLEVSLPIGDETEGQDAPAAVLRLTFAEGGEKTVVSCNGRTLELRAESASGAWIAEPDRGVVRNGANAVAIRAAGPAVLTDLQLWVFPSGCAKRLEATTSLRDVMKRRETLTRNRRGER